MIEDIKTFGIWRALKFAWQRVYKGVDDTFFWEMDSYLNYYFIPAIKEFCEERLKECKDERFIEVYKTMLEKIDKFDKEEEVRLTYPSANSEMWSFFGNNIEFFWS